MSFNELELRKLSGQKKVVIGALVLAETQRNSFNPALPISVEMSADSVDLSMGRQKIV